MLAALIVPGAALLRELFLDGGCAQGGQHVTRKLGGQLRSMWPGAYRPNQGSGFKPLMPASSSVGTSGQGRRTHRRGHAQGAQLAGLDVLQDAGHRVEHDGNLAAQQIVSSAGAAPS